MQSLPNQQKRRFDMLIACSLATLLFLFIFLTLLFQPPPTAYPVYPTLTILTGLGVIAALIGVAYSIYELRQKTNGKQTPNP